MSEGFFERRFSLRENGTTLSRELRGGTVTFFAMAYIIFVQPAILSGEMLGVKTGLDFGAVMIATCLTAAVATAIMPPRGHTISSPSSTHNASRVIFLLPYRSALEDYFS